MNSLQTKRKAVDVHPEQRTKVEDEEESIELDDLSWSTPDNTSASIHYMNSQQKNILLSEPYSNSMEEEEEEEEKTVGKDDDLLSLEQFFNCMLFTLVLLNNS